jgi:hypothetical protein
MIEGMVELTFSSPKNHVSSFMWVELSREGRCVPGQRQNFQSHLHPGGYVTSSHEWNVCIYMGLLGQGI